MSITQFNKEYLTYTKQEAKKWHLFLGGSPNVVNSTEQNQDPRTPTEDFNWGTDVNILYRIRENDINFITQRNDWARRIITIPWKSNESDITNKLIFNAVNNIAYLCVSDNVNNRSDLSIRGKNLSFDIPSHSVGVQTYQDGYSWFALFKIDSEKLDLVTLDYIPVPSLENYSTTSSSASLEYLYTQKCGSNYKTENGTCCLYNKTEGIDGVGICFEKGELSATKFVSKCYQCYETAKKLNYDFSFFEGITIPPLYPVCSPCECTKVITSPIESIVENIQNINPTSAYRHLYESYTNWYPFKQGILSIFINLENLTDSQKTIQYENPYIIFNSIEGSGGLARLKTTPASNGHYVYGIELISRGTGYGIGGVKPVIENLENNILNSRIEVNVCPEEFPENPSIMLNNLKTCVKASIDNIQINEVLGTEIIEFTKFGLIKDIKTTNTNKKAVDPLNDNEFQILRATTKLKLTPSKPNELPRQNPYLNLSDKTDVKFSNSDDKKGTQVYFKYMADKTGVCGANMELITKDYNNFVKGDTLKVTDTFSYVIDEINKPDVIFGSGNPLIRRNFYAKLPVKSTDSFKPHKSLTFTIIKS